MSSKEPKSYINVYPSDVSNLEGQLLTAIEALGLPDIQDNGAKGLVRNILWNWNDKIYNSAIPSIE